MKQKKKNKPEMLIISRRIKVGGRWHVLAIIKSDEKKYSPEETEMYAKLFLSMADKIPCASCGYTYDYRRSMAVVYIGDMEEVVLAMCSRCEPSINRSVRETLKQLTVGHD
jgi:hypothetical protein